MKLNTASLRGNRKRSAFTLIELLVVIAIIAILAALVLRTSSFVQEKAGRSRAEAEIKALESALEAYKLDNGTYPRHEATPTVNGTDDSTKELLDAIYPKDTSNGEKLYYAVPAKMLNAYLKKDSEQTVRNNSTYLVDPFGNAYHYQFPGAADRSGAAFFDLWSTGKNAGEANQAKWIKNW